jgi:hypothetical protein
MAFYTLRKFENNIVLISTKLFLFRYSGENTFGN